MRRAAFLRILLIGMLLHAYIGIRLIPDAPWNTAGRIAAVLFLVASCFLIPAGFLSRRLRRPMPERVVQIGLLLMGFFSSLFVLTFLRDILLVLVFTGQALSGWRISAFAPAAASAVAVPLLALLFTLVGFGNARRRARIVRVDVPIANLPEALHGFTIAQISDVHVGSTIKRRYVDAIVDAVNSLEADMIAVTGDIVDGSVPQLSRHTQPLARLAARHGAFFVTGNHEYYSGAAAWVAEFTRLGMRTLMNEHVMLAHDGAALLVGGVTDFGAGQFDPAQRSDPAAAIAGMPPGTIVKLLLAHQPRSAPAAAQAGFTLQLSGHTHGGQFFPWNFFVRIQQPVTAGLAKLDGLWVYTSRGTGYWGPPKRLCAPSEITHLRLVDAGAA